MSGDIKQIINESDHIVFFGGAGVSTESGIPDFRSEKGLYHAKNKYGHSPEILLSHTFFMQNPEVFFEYYLENLIHTEAEPNAAHESLAKLEKQGKLKAVITQNIDGLHQKAGSEAVYELHGSVLRNYCIGCGEKYALDYMLSPNRVRGKIPLCEACGGIVRPDVVLYEEPLDGRVWQKSVYAVDMADTLIVGGTSLAVYPAAGLLQGFHGRYLILINRCETAYDDKANLVIHDSIGKVLSDSI